jgi:hypothetical protein
MRLPSYFWLTFICSIAGLLADVSKHSVTWGTLLPEPGINFQKIATFHNSMPIGNGNIAANVNYESADDTIAVLLATTAGWREDGETMKVALLNIKLPSRDGAPINGSGFAQTFNPQDATVRFTIPQAGSSAALSVVAYADANSDSIVVSISPPVAGIIASFTALHPSVYTTMPSQDCAYYNISADIVAAGGAMLYHRNALQGADTFMAKTFAHENLPLVPGFADSLLNRTTGAVIAQLPSSTSKAFAITILTVQTETAAAYEELLASASAAFVAGQKTKQFPPAAHNQWWASKWAAHSIEITANGGAASVDRITSMYVWQRFLELAQSRGPAPIKFNGMLFSANRPNASKHWGDFNMWGGLQWWQNLRHPYYNMLTSDDADGLKHMLLTFNRTRTIALHRTRTYFGFDGLWWPENTHTFYGTQHPGCQTAHRTGAGNNYTGGLCGYRAGPGCTEILRGQPIWHDEDVWNGYNRQGSLDLSLMVLDHYAYTGDTSSGLLGIPMGVVEFYSNLWGNTSSGDGSGTGGDDKMVFHPTQALETWQCPGWPVDPTNCPTNDMPTVAGLHIVVEKLLRLPADLASDAQREAWMKIQARLPDLPASIDGVYMACADCTLGGTGPGSHKLSNGENAELYSVHPYRLATVGRGDADALSKAKAAYTVRKSRSDVGWNQNVMDAALMGDVTEAATLLTARAMTPPALGYRFAAFAPREQDYEPSADHFSIFSNALQYMLIQRVDDAEDSVLLLPTWPCQWDVDFKLSAPRATTVTGSLKNGTLSYSVVPAARSTAVRAAKCQQLVPTPPPQSSCNVTLWDEMCPPEPSNISTCMHCCGTHNAALVKMGCDSPKYDWSVHCAGCSPWGCTCQGMSEWYGTNNAVGWGCAPSEAQAWWMAHQCKTHSTKYPCHNPPAPCAAPGCHHPSPTPI